MTIPSIFSASIYTDLIRAYERTSCTNGKAQEKRLTRIRSLAAMVSKQTFIVGVFIATLSSSAMAGVIPYPDIGTPAPANTFTATSNGDITAYFYASDAGATSEIGMSVNGATPTIFGLNNHTSARGDMLNLGYANAGDSIEFVLRILPASSGVNYYSTPAHNSDGDNCKAPACVANSSRAFNLKTAATLPPRAPEAG